MEARDKLMKAAPAAAVAYEVIDELFRADGFIAMNLGRSSLGSTQCLQVMSLTLTHVSGLPEPTFKDLLDTFNRVIATLEKLEHETYTGWFNHRYKHLLVQALSAGKYKPWWKIYYKTGGIRRIVEVQVIIRKVEGRLVGSMPPGWTEATRRCT